MSLTAGRGPFSKDPTGELNIPVEPVTGSVLLWWPVPQRIRAILGGETVVDSTRARLLHETGLLPVYYFPDDEVRFDLLEPTARRTHCPHKGEASYWTIRAGRREEPDAVWAYREPLEPASFLRGHVSLYWHAADEWFAEDDQLFGHPRDPFHRIDVHPTARRVRVLLDGEVLADSVRALGLFETALPPRWYLPPGDVRLDLLEPSAKKTRCAYKGSASYWHVRAGERLEQDVVWSYPEPQHDAGAVRGMLCFFASGSTWSSTASSRSGRARSGRGRRRQTAVAERRALRPNVRKPWRRFPPPVRGTCDATKGDRMTVHEMLRTHPRTTIDSDALARCVEECFACAATCTSCADACVGEESVQELVRCIRLNLDCADTCDATGRILIRQTMFEPQLARHMLEACAQACRTCAEECERHAGHHEHCRVCAEACRRCEQSCEDLLSSIG